MKICSIEECNNKHYAFGFCEKHYKQIKKNGKISKKTNEIIKYDDHAEMILYDKDYIEIARTLIDLDDVDKVKDIKWRIQNKQRPYVMSGRANNIIRLHNYLMNNIDTGFVTDHINHNPLDNRKINLRICTQQENMFNLKKQKTQTSQYKGVYYFKSNNSWKSTIIYNDRTINIGYFMNEKDAGLAYDNKARELFGEFAYLNFPDECIEDKILENRKKNFKDSKKRSDNSSGYKNVCWNKAVNKWVVSLRINGKEKRLGSFPYEELEEAGKFAEEMREIYYNKTYAEVISKI